MKQFFCFDLGVSCNQIFKTYGISYTHEDIDFFIINFDTYQNNLFDFSQSINQYMMSL